MHKKKFQLIFFYFFYFKDFKNNKVFQMFELNVKEILESFILSSLFLNKKIQHSILLFNSIN